MAILGEIGHFQACRKWPKSKTSLELISVHQTIKGDLNNGLDELEPNRS